MTLRILFPDAYFKGEMRENFLFKRTNQLVKPGVLTMTSKLLIHTVFHSS